VSESTRSEFSENTIAALSYLTFAPAILFLILPRYNKSSYVRFHAWQSILLNIVAFVISVALSLLAEPALKHGAYFILGLVRVMWGVWFGLWIATALTALNGRRFRILFIGPLAERTAR
jgi:uncharacterized membrane protein